MLHKESDEGRRQLARLGLVDQGEQLIETEGGEQGEVEVPEIEPPDQAAPDQARPAKEVIVKPPEAALRNQFNYSERASQTFNNPYRVNILLLFLMFLFPHDAAVSHNADLPSLSALSLRRG